MAGWVLSLWFELWVWCIECEDAVLRGTTVLGPGASSRTARAAEGSLQGGLAGLLQRQPVAYELWSCVQRPTTIAAQSSSS